MLDLQISLHAALAGSQAGVTIHDDTTSWGAGGNPARVGSALVVGAQWLSAGSAAGIPLSVAYDPVAFQSVSGGDVFLPFDRDGLLRVVVAALPICSVSAAQLLATDTAYLDTNGVPRVRRVGLSADPVLNTFDLLGEGTGAVPLVLSYAAAYYLNDQGLRNALGRLNLRYLRLPYNQQHELVALYERAALYQTGVQQLYDQGRYLDAAAILQAAQYLLSTDGQTPDDFGPVLGGAFPYTAS